MKSAKLHRSGKGASSNKVCMLVLNEVITDGRVMRAATALAENYDLVVLGWLRPERKDKLPKETIENLPFKLHLVELWTAKKLPKNAPGYAGRYLEALIRMLRIGVSTQPCVIHAHELSGLLIGYVLKKLTRGRLVYDAHELYREQTIWQSKFIIRIIGWLETYLMQACEEIIACNRQRADIMYKEYGSPVLPKVIRNLPPFSQPTESDSSLRDFVKRQNSDINHIIVHPGGLVHRGEAVVLSALRKTPEDVALVLLGHKNQNMSAEMEHLIREYNIGDRIFWHPPVPYDELIGYLNSADLGLVLYPNTCRNNYYCASNKIYEFAMCGLPIVSVDFPPCKDILEQYRYGVCFSWNDSDDLARAITECLKDRSRYQQMRKEALRAAGRENWDQEKLRLLEIYDQVRERSSPCLSATDG